MTYALASVTSEVYIIPTFLFTLMLNAYIVLLLLLFFVYQDHSYLFTIDDIYIVNNLIYIYMYIEETQ